MFCALHFRMLTYASSSKPARAKVVHSGLHMVDIMTGVCVLAERERLCHWLGVWADT